MAARKTAEDAYHEEDGNSAVTKYGKTYHGKFLIRCHTSYDTACMSTETKLSIGPFELSQEHGLVLKNMFRFACE